MFFWLKLGAIAAAIVAALVAWEEHNAHEQAKGRAEVQAQLSEATAAKATRDAELEHIGRQTADEQLARAVQRQRLAESRLASGALARRALSDALAAKDADYREWRDLPVPAAVIDGMRAHVDLVTRSNRAVLSGGVPAGAGSTGAGVIQ